MLSSPRIVARGDWSNRRQNTPMGSNFEYIELWAIMMVAMMHRHRQCVNTKNAYTIENKATDIIFAIRRRMF